MVGWLTNDTRALAGKQRLARELCSWAARPALNPPAGFDERVVAKLKVERAKAGDRRWTSSRNDPGAKPSVDAMLWPRLAAGPERQPLADQAVGDYNTAIAAVGRGEYERAAVVLRRYDWRHRPLLGG